MNSQQTYNALLASFCARHQGLCFVDLNPWIVSHCNYERVRSMLAGNTELNTDRDNLTDQPVLRRPGRPDEPAPQLGAHPLHLVRVFRSSFSRTCSQLHKPQVSHHPVPSKRGPRPRARRGRGRRAGVPQRKDGPHGREEDLRTDTSNALLGYGSAEAVHFIEDSPEGPWASVE